MRRCVGWVERSDTHLVASEMMMGVAALDPSCLSSPASGVRSAGFGSRSAAFSAIRTRIAPTNGMSQMKMT
ncbi:MAG: hypothetical protein IPI73_29990 [Betaproteobacteria bacterium]|nr:hypothetical protein [Betaproteobacteria bacterium]